MSYNSNKMLGDVRIKAKFTKIEPFYHAKFGDQLIIIFTPEGEDEEFAVHDFIQMDYPHVLREKPQGLLKGILGENVSKDLAMDKKALKELVKTHLFEDFLIDVTPSFNKKFNSIKCISKIKGNNNEN